MQAMVIFKASKKEVSKKQRRGEIRQDELRKICQGALDHGLLASDTS